MRTERVIRRLPAGADAPGSLTLREPCGHDELAIQGIDTRSAIELLDRLLEQRLPGGATCLNASDRDALLAALHRLCWSDAITATRTCAACEQSFDLSFSLSGLQRNLQEHLRSLDPRWSLPTATAELGCEAALSDEQGVGHLMSACGIQPGDLEEAALALEEAAPILDVDLEATCPECGHPQWALFDLQSFLLQRLLSEREGLLDEVHLLARTYGWSLDDILGLARRTRRTLAQRILDGKFA
jgi:hypothetical protein